MAYQHDPVLASEAADFLNLADGQTVVDATLGGGGHTLKIKDQKSKVKIIGFDQDADALAAAKKNLAAFADVAYVHDNFARLKDHLAGPVDGILFDLGVSSHQLDEGARGFSLQHDGPLDMRMDRNAKLSAADLINNWPEDKLAKLFYEYGEEKFSRRIAKAICSARDEGREPETGNWKPGTRERNGIQTTFQLKEIVEKAIPTWKKRESVTRIFQALRIAVNDELNVLKKALEQAIELLKPGGRIVVISYHSLEDRAVKQMFRESAKNGRLKILTKKPLTAGAAELAVNPRARSAKLRAAEKS